MKDHYKHSKPAIELEKAEFIYYGGATFLRPRAFEAVHRKLKRLKRVRLYSPNTTSSRQILLLGGDFSVNLGPDVEKQKNSKPECAGCNRAIAKNHRNVSCNLCLSRQHFKYAGLTVNGYQQTQHGWTCTKCLFEALPHPDTVCGVSETEISDPENDITQDLTSVGT